MRRILMVCLGNICRSPLAEGILKSKIDSNKVFVDSAGTADYHIGNLPDNRSIEVAKKHNIDISNQRCRKFEVKDFDNFDEIFVMDESNYQNVILKARKPEDKRKVKMILAEIYNSNVSIPDPYYEGDKGFETVYQMLDEACSVISNRL